MQDSAPLAIDTFLPYMRDVVRCEQSLRELNLMWRMIEASAKMNCPAEASAILPTMAATRAGFNRRGFRAHVLVPARFHREARRVRGWVAAK